MTANQAGESLQYRIEALIEELTVEEKVMLTVGRSSWRTHAVDRLDIPSIWLLDGPNGVRRKDAEEDVTFGASRQATCFPAACAIASSWDVELIERVGQALGDECLAYDAQVLLGPGLNIKRTPLCGRNFEYFSEDPMLSGELATAMVNGIQSRGVGTSVKHFACNNQETQRMSIDVDVDERTFREIYLTGFERVVKAAKPWTVMASYNRLHGSYAAENHRLLTDILKNEWGFAGVVVSDWGAVVNKVHSILAGLDLEMPGPTNQAKVIAQVHAGEIPLPVLNEAVRRVLHMVFQLYQNRQPDTQVNLDEHHQLARRAAAESIVLLKNDESVLPLVSSQLQRVTVIGQFAKLPRYQGAGSAQIWATREDVPLDELQNALGFDVSIAYYEGYPLDDRALTREEADTMVEAAVKAATSADVAVIYAGLPESYESEGYDRTHIHLPPLQNRLIEAVAEAQPKTVVVLANGSAVAMPWATKVKGIVESWLGGQAVGGAIADVLTGKVNPSGKLPETFPVSLEDTPAFLNYPGDEGVVHYGEGLFVGYRYYDKKHIKPLFPFGHGLSYTRFEYANLRVSATEVTNTDVVEICADIRNAGEVAGSEIVQLYVRDVESRVARPVKELKGFTKVFLQPGEQQTVIFSLNPRDFAFYDSTVGEWFVESGEFELLISASSADIRLRTRILMKSSQEEKIHYNLFTPVKYFLRDASVVEMMIAAMPQELQSQAMQVTDDAGPTLDLAFVMDVPIIKVVGFSQGAISEEMLQVLCDELNGRAQEAR